MSNSSIPKEVLEILRRTSSTGLPAALLSPHWAEGTVIFDQPEETLSVRGDFFAGKTKVTLPEIQRCQMFLAESRIVLNVIMFPGRFLERSNVEHFRFELAPWKSMEQTSPLQPRCPPMTDWV